MKKVFIVGAKRTAIGTFGGTLKNTSAVDLGVVAANGAIEQAGIKKESIDEAIVGNVLTAGQGMGPARQVSLNSGIPVQSPAFTVNMVCGSGMKSTMIGASDIRLGDVDIALTGGMENMSMAPYLLKGARFGYRLGDGELYDHLVNDGLTCIFNNYHMGQTAENIAEEYGITREEQDLFSLESQKRTDKAIKEDRFREEIVPVEIKTSKKQIIFDTDEHPKGDTTMEILGKLRTVFKKDGSVTAGNASGINDGASMTVIMSEEKMNELNIKPLVEIVSYSQSGVAPKIMGMGPVEAVDLALEKANLKLEDVGLFELNEAFAVQSIAVMRQMAKRNGVSEEWLNERTNVNGGAISLGHPIGCSGNRILVTLIYEMKKRKVKYGLAALCIGGGMGTAMIIRNTEV